jgi:hypothetical protein
VASVEIRIPGQNWQSIAAGYTHTSAVWTRTSLDLSAFAGSTIELAFRFKSNTDGNVAPGWYIDEVEVISGTAAFDIVSQPESFDSGLGNWTVDRGDWQVGVPTYGPGKAYRGTYCAGTVLTGNYDAGLDTRLISPEFTLPTAERQPRLRFWHWYSIYAGDSASVELRLAGGSWQAISPAYTNTSAAWTRATLDLGAFAGQTVQIAFHLRANVDGNVAPGWYVDDVQVAAGVPEFNIVNAPEGFELGMRDWSVDRGDWQVGAPVYGPGKAYRAANCAGTVLAGNYDAGIDSRLISPAFVVPAATEQPRLRFWHWFSVYAGDLAMVEIRPDGGDWQPLSPTYGSTSAVWTRTSLDLRSFAGQKVQIAFHLKANNDGNVAAGWYLDDVEVATGKPAFNIVNAPDGFELGLRDWIVDKGDWQVGVPTYGPGKAYRGTSCAGTVLAGNYDANIDSRLISPAFIVPAEGEQPRLRFWHWFSVYAGDQAMVQIRPAGGDWQLLSPFYANTSAVWTRTTLDLRLFAGQEVQIAFRLKANTDGNVAAGWYVDDVEVATGSLVYNLVNQPEGFDMGLGNWSVDKGDWQVGLPAAGPGKAFRGTLCAGTVLAGNYDANLRSSLVSPEFYVPCAEAYPRLRFAHWYHIAAGDAAYVQLWQESTGWVNILGPISGTGGEWATAFVDLTPFAGKKSRLGFYFTSNSDGNVAPGWYVDEVRIQADILAPLENRTVTEGNLLAFPISALCGDLQCSLAPGAPEGATIDPALGFFTWAPAECQGPGTHSVTVEVAPRADPRYVLGSTTFWVTVLETNAPPVIDPIAPKTAKAGVPLNFTVTAFDPDCPQTQTLSFSLDQGAPAGCAIDSRTGAFTWTPTGEQAAAANRITIRVTDNGTPPLSATAAFTAGPAPPPALRLSLQRSPAGASQLQIDGGPPGAEYSIQAAAELAAPAELTQWTTLGVLRPTEIPFTFADPAPDAGDRSSRFYRVTARP